MQTSENTAGKKIVLISPHGFCAGVERAVKIAERLLTRGAKPVYCLNEVVHNKQIVGDLARRGMIFVKDVEDVPSGTTVLFSAHGVAPDVRNKAIQRGLKIVDATCPFVNKVHLEVKRFAAAGHTILLIGHGDHDEIIGVAGEAPTSVRVIETEKDAREVIVDDESKVAVMTQTTLTVDEVSRTIDVLRGRFPQLKTTDTSDICYATQNRQAAVRSFARKADVFIVLGARNSSNSNRLVEVAKAGGCRAFLVSELDEIAGIPLGSAKVIGLTAGASTPEYFVEEAIACLAKIGFTKLENLVVVREDMHFSVPE